MTNSNASLLMCPPAYFDVQYVINPWMEGNIGKVVRSRARKQWDALVRILSDRSEVRIVDPIAGQPDMCFAANAGLKLENLFVPSLFRVPQRVPEVPVYTEWIRAQGIEVRDIPDDCTFEGEGDALFQPGRDILWAGYGVRSSLASHKFLTEFFRCPVYSLRLVDERFYHLDTCFVPLPQDRVMVYPAAFDRRSRDLIREHFEPSRRIEVGDGDAQRFCCNAVRVGNTLVANHVSDALRRKLEDWDLEVVTTDLSEFILAGGAAKCLCMLLDQDAVVPLSERKAVESPISSERLELTGHLLDSGLLNRAMDAVTAAGGSFRVEQFRAGLRHDQTSLCRLRASAPDRGALNRVLKELQGHGAVVVASTKEASRQAAPADGVAPEGFYSTTIYPTDVYIGGRWIRAEKQRMDAVLVIDGGAGSVRCELLRNLRAGDAVVCGVEGIAVHTPETARTEEAFAFMSAGVSSERRVERVVEELALEMKRIRSRGGRLVVVAGPVVIHTGGGQYLAEMIRNGYVQALLTGNALPTHDIELNMFGTSLGVDMKRGTGVPLGHQYHLRAINRIRAAGSIAAAVEQGLVTGGVMYECIRRGVEFVAVGSIRDDGPLPETMMDLCRGQAACAGAIEGADMILMLSSMLHSIGVGNMTPSGVRLICVDINPAVVTKLADRGSVESTGIVTDVGLFLNLLAHYLSEDADDEKYEAAVAAKRLRTQPAPE
ncbi:MAG: TIGR00300 family protein [Acidobacteria bacterium]|nr:TIGR00300 family protein [Acidobacteriota bacterium]